MPPKIRERERERKIFFVFFYKAEHKNVKGVPFAPRL